MGCAIPLQTLFQGYAQKFSAFTHPLGKCAVASSCILASETADLVPRAQRSKQWSLFIVATVINPAS